MPHGETKSLSCKRMLTMTSEKILSLILEQKCTSDSVI